MKQIVSFHEQRLQRALGGMQTLIEAYNHACQVLDNICFNAMPDQYDLEQSAFFRRAYPRLKGRDLKLDGIAIHFDRALQSYELAVIPAKMALIHNSQSLGAAAVHISLPNQNNIKVV